MVESVIDGTNRVKQLGGHLLIDSAAEVNFLAQYFLRSAVSPGVDSRELAELRVRLHAATSRLLGQINDLKL